jgi:galactokinase
MGKLEGLIAAFERTYGTLPEKIARAPGRVNLIGEHTDYNDGWVMPIAIDREVYIAGRHRSDRQIVVTALDVENGQCDEFSLDRVEVNRQYRWANYVRGVAFVLMQQRAPVSGMDLMITSTLPQGAGLSSSAALEVATATILQAFAQRPLVGVALARLCQRAENEFVGVKSGIMDQYASVLGEQDKALKIDCRALTYEAVRLPHGVAVVVADTNKKHSLTHSEYNTRRAECEQAAQRLGELLGNRVDALRDVSPEELARVGKELPENLHKRARHIISENERVLEASRAAERDDAVTFGALMNESHTSLRDDYEASSVELDLMVELARAQSECLGARLTGAGWGGATVNLVREEHLNRFVENVSRLYHERTGIAPWIAPVHASAGAGIVK